MTDVINAVRVSDEEAPTTAEEQPGQQVEKPKAKRSAKQPITQAVEPTIEVKQAFEEVQAVVELPKEDGGVKQACPDCGKQMSAKTLKYSHTCPATKKQNPITPRGESPDRKTIYPTDELIEWEVQRRLDGRRRERAVRREEMVNKLMQGAF